MEKKDIIRVYSNSVVSKTIFGWNLSTASVCRTVVSFPIFRHKGKDYIGLRETVANGEVITVGKRMFKYMVTGNPVVMRDGRVVSTIERIDGYSMTQLDVENSTGADVWINRMSADKILEIFNSI